ncbi:hypothetical protein HPB48_019183 [Haemaphysalis longicornis]|uniref:Endonuclease/exonuclease/phosphatase domain-containing protein n=1 Tax=Haemaphysalis longicornis TaxID=44386 RepID=A0A9J6GQ23_HAELO|nr:hypothetical protein HPB48_019183 [Haemaphysalis longicornis]
MRTTGHDRHALSAHASNGYICVTLTHKRQVISVIGAYIPPRADVDCTYLSSVVHTCPGPHIIVGDFNAPHPLWGSAATNKEGNDMADFIHDESFVSINDGSPTFCGPRSCLDLAIVSRTLSPSETW